MRNSLQMVLHIELEHNNATLEASLSIWRGLYLILKTHYNVLLKLFKILRCIFNIRLLRTPIL